MPSAHNVIFDLGGVVLDWNPDRILSTFAPNAEARAQLRSDVFRNPDWAMFDRGTLGETELLRRLQIRTGRSAEHVAAILHAVREALVPKPDTVALLQSLHSRRVPLYCLSNMPASIFAHLRQRYTLFDYFRGSVISGEIRMAKPDREIFDYLLGQFGLQARHSVFIDDTEANVEAAARAGLQVIWFQDAAQCRSELERLLPPARA